MRTTFEDSFADLNSIRFTGSSILNVMICFNTEAQAAPFTYNSLAGKFGVQEAMMLGSGASLGDRLEVRRSFCLSPFFSSPSTVDPPFTSFRTFPYHRYLPLVRRCH